MNPIKSKSGSKKLPCGHIFHMKCVYDWYSSGAANGHCCALCRTPWIKPKEVPKPPTAPTAEDIEQILIAYIEVYGLPNFDEVF